jgi:hypothetical protein
VIVVPRLSRAGQLALWAALATCSRQSQVSTGAGAASASDSTPTADARTIEPTSTLADAAQVASDAADNDAAQAFAELRPRASRADAGARSSRDPAAAAARQALLAVLSQSGPGDIRTIFGPGMNNGPPVGAAAYGAPPIAIPGGEFSDGVTTERSVRGSLSISQVRDNTGTLEAALRRQMGPLRSCFERELRNNPTLAGVATLTMTINPAGQPEGVAIASAVAPEPMIACLTRRIVAMRLPLSPSAPAAVSAVLRFTPVS